MRVYLAGPIFQCKDHECIDWRKEARRKLGGFEIIDPMERDYRGSTDENYKRIVEVDKALIDKCDILLVNHFKPSVGTSMEILYAPMECLSKTCVIWQVTGLRQDLILIL